MSSVEENVRVAVLVKQVPQSDELVFVDGRLQRHGVPVEVNAYCRRANAKAVELTGAGGEVVVFTMAPPAADDALREMIACGATRGVHLCDSAFAGSDTLATARALAVAIHREGPFDLVLCGLNSIDADTGQVGPELAELLGLPFVAGAREIDHDAAFRTLTILCETDAGHERVRCALPAVVSTAERLCDPSKAPPERRAAVDTGRIVVRSAGELRLWPHQVGATGSPTAVGAIRDRAHRRAAQIVSSAEEAVGLLRDRGALVPGRATALDTVAVHAGGPREIWCALDPDTEPPRRELLGEAAALATRIGATVTAILTRPPTAELGSAGADRVLVVPSVHTSDAAERLAVLVGRHRPRIVLVEGTTAGRVIASKVAARHGLGLIGDGVEIETDDDGALTVWKPALGGRLLAAITSRSDVQVATIRPGVLPPRAPRPPRDVPVETHVVPVEGRTVELLSRTTFDTGRAELAGAEVVIGVGLGVAPDDYPLLDPLRDLLGAAIGATRKVTDRGWLPRGRQIGITGISISPRLYVAIGSSGRFNHIAGFQAAANVLAINSEPDAEIFAVADIGVVGDWRRVVTDLEPTLAAELGRERQGIA